MTNTQNIRIICSLSFSEICSLTNYLNSTNKTIEQTSNFNADSIENDIQLEPTLFTYKYICGGELPVKSISKEFILHLLNADLHQSSIHGLVSTLSLCDGIIITINCLTEPILIKNEMKKIIPILSRFKLQPIFFFDSFETLFSSDPDLNEIYDKLRSYVDALNEVISTTGFQDFNTKVDPTKGNILFGQYEDHWAFSIVSFSKMYAKKFGINEDKMTNKLWNDIAFDAKKKKFIKLKATVNNKSLKRCFIQFILEPIYKIYQLKFDKDVSLIKTMMKRIGLKEPQNCNNWNNLRFYKYLMKNWLPLTELFFNTIVFQIPSPKDAQKLKNNELYTGPLSDNFSQAIQRCKTNNPLIISLPKIIPSTNTHDVFLFGRILSGTIALNDSVYFSFTEKTNRGIVLKKKKIEITKLYKIDGYQLIKIEKLHCGNLIALRIPKTLHNYDILSISSEKECFPIKNFYQVDNSVSSKVLIKHANILPNLYSDCIFLSRIDRMIKLKRGKRGAIKFNFYNLSHMEKTLKKLKKKWENMQLIISDPQPIYREIVTKKSIKITKILSNNTNNEDNNENNSITISCEPLDKKYYSDIKKSKLFIKEINNNLDQYFIENHNWETNESKKIWSFGENYQNTNLLMNLCNSNNNNNKINEIKEFVLESFNSLMKKGPLCNEEMMGVQINIESINLPKKKTVSNKKIIEIIRSAMEECVLLSKPTLVEPINTCVIITPKNQTENVYNTIRQVNGELIEHIKDQKFDILSFLIPQRYSSDIRKKIRSNTKGMAFSEITEHHWQKINDDPYDTNLDTFKIIIQIRKEKDLDLTIPKIMEK
ncbi:translation elongation factor-related [Anaeramoeba flamelloides]|uniref:Elongation factor 2 n=1 Tax=Anaeramoeba flamelloides TaxID=1746091 RepID=A0AAV7Z8M9_9EUKA|nr:translation elongation factor-related [Anaeramoeba flamelloides]